MTDAALREYAARHGGVGGPYCNTVVIWTTVPVGIVTNPMTGEVEQVVVLDDHINPSDPNAEYWDPAYKFPSSEYERQRARQIANNETLIWPRWQFGW